MDMTALVPEFSLGVVLMVVVEFVLLASTFVGAILALDRFGSRFKLGKKLRGLFTADIDKKVDGLHENLNAIRNTVMLITDRVSDIEADQLKLVIIDRRMPIEERIQAANKYLDAGYNGAMQVRIEALREVYREYLQKNESVEEIERRNRDSA
jgi:hypothetical protein